MSWEGAPPVGPTSIQRYFCHQCNRTVYIAPSSPELVCPTCNGGFLEEIEYPGPNPTFNHFPSGFPLLLSTPSAPDRDSDASNPFLFLQNYLQAMISGGANIQFVLENDPSASRASRLPANLGDYFIGPGLEQLIQQLAENDPNRYGTPPASKEAVDALPDVRVSAESLDSDSVQCAVCKDEFVLGELAKRLPCRHMYHPDCILPWLALHNSCPVCRYELPSDDPDHESQTRGTEVPQDSVPAALPDSGGSEASSERNSASVQTAENVAGARTAEHSPWVRTGERRSRFQFPWPFNAFGSPAETSSSGHGGNDSNDGEGGNENRGNCGDQENRDFGWGTR